MLCCPETNAAVERSFPVEKDFFANEKSRLNADIVAVKIQCGELTIKFNMKNISCSEISNILLENDILIKKYLFNGKYSFN